MKNGYYTKSRKPGTSNGYTWYVVTLRMGNGATFDTEASGKSAEDAETQAVKTVKALHNIDTTAIASRTMYA